VLGQWAFTLFMYSLGGCLLTVALTPAFVLTLALWKYSVSGSLICRALALGAGAGFGYFLFGLTLAALTVLLRFVLGARLKEGEFGFFTWNGFVWAFVNAMMLIVNLTFMDFMRLTPLLPLYYRLMGARIGRGVQINSKGLADVSMLEIGDGTVIGGDAVVLGHLAERGKLKLRPTRIGRKVTIGLGAVIMPGCVIGDGAVIAARSVLPKGAEVPPNCLFAGTPAKFVKTLSPETS